MQISETDKFKKDFKKLQKKYRTLESDFEIFKQVITDNPTGEKAPLRCDYITTIKDKYISFFKARMMCRSVKGSKFRVIYMYDGKNLELQFIDIYFKGSKKVNDKERINDIVKELQQD